MALTIIKGARIIIKGLSHHSTMNYGETYDRVAHISSIRLTMALVAQNRIHINKHIRCFVIKTKIHLEIPEYTEKNNYRQSQEDVFRAYFR